MAQWLPQNSIYSQNMINYCVKYDELNVELLLIESPQSSLYVYLQFLLGYRDVFLFDVIGEQDRSSESLFASRKSSDSCQHVDYQVDSYPLN